MIAPVVAGVVGVTANVDAVVTTQAPTAATLTLPDVVLGVAVIELVVEVPVHPPGKVQV